MKKITKTAMMALAAISLSYCGQVETGTHGVSLTGENVRVFNNTNETNYTLYKPSMILIPNGDTKEVTIKLSVQDASYLAYFEISRDASGVETKNAVNYIGNTQTDYSTGAMGAGSFNFTVKAFYEINGEFLASEATDTINITFTQPAGGSGTGTGGVCTTNDEMAGELGVGVCQ